MKIPKKFRIGRRVYKVVEPRKIFHPGALGRFFPTEQEVHVAQEHPRSKFLRKDKDRFQTFWHETTHAMLRDMGSPKTFDEVFVDQLAKRIAGVIQSVEF